MDGGSLERSLEVTDGSEVTFSGGFIGSWLRVTDSSLKLIGGNFRINGQSITEMEQPGISMPLTLAEDSLLSGTLADGTPFKLSNYSWDGNIFDNVDLQLTSVELPPPAPGFILAAGGAPQTISEGQTLFIGDSENAPDSFLTGKGSSLVVAEGGTLGEGAELVGAILLINGGVVERLLKVYNGSTVLLSEREITELPIFAPGRSHVISGGKIGNYGRGCAYGASITLNGGDLGQRFEVRDNSIVNVNDGTVGIYFEAYESAIYVNGGYFRDSLDAYEGSEVTISGGRIDGWIRVRDGVLTMTGGVASSVRVEDESISQVSGGILGFLATRGTADVEVFGGAIDNHFNIGGNSRVTLVGNDFRLNGLPIAGLDYIGATTTQSLPSEEDVLTGTFSDGTPFLFTLNDGYNLLDEEGFHLRIKEPVATEAGVIIASEGNVPMGLRDGQTLIVDAGGKTPDAIMASWGSRFEIEQGVPLDSKLIAYGADINIHGGNSAPRLKLIWTAA